MSTSDHEPKIRTIAETENNFIYSSEDPDGETTYNLQINNVTINFFKEEWDEFLDLVRQLPREEKR